MRRIGGKALLALMLGAGLLSGCGDRTADPKLLNVRKSGQGPDEFGILPTKPLQAPQDYRSLPPPTPGGRNLTDPTPDDDAVAALGGSVGAAHRGGVEGGIVAYAGRYGVQPGIRQNLAVADLEYRRANDGRLLERLFSVNVYFKAYKPYELDQYAELERLRRAGVKTPSAPPDPARK